MPSLTKPFKRSVKSFKFNRTPRTISLLHPATNDLYHWLLSISWRKFLLIVALIYTLANFFFALIYMTDLKGIANARPGSLSDAFFFSVQTLSTVGYGSMYPTSLYVQILVMLEILIGLVLMAILTGLMFARFSRPTAKVVFSQVAVVCPYNGIPTLMFRAANKRESKILEAQIQVTLLRNEVSPEGHKLRHFYDLYLMRSRTPVFGLSWLVMHPIVEGSPFFGETLETLKEVDAELWVSLSGLDETFFQTVHARYFYTTEDMLWNRSFVDIFSQNEQGEWFIDLSNFHDVIPYED
jgi:inward rectifier potassium channel